MNKQLVLLLFLCCSSFLWSQETTVDSLTVHDEKFREDQFYVGITYNLLTNRPIGVSQRGFSNGIHLGFMRDMPINEKRTLAIAVGLGYAGNTYNDNLLLTEDEMGDIQYQIIEGTNFRKNKIAIHRVEIPLHFRWRNVTIDSHKFWRVYTGIKVGYTFASKSKFKGDLGTFRIGSPKDLNKLQYGLVMNFGYNTWNFHVNYVLNDLFKSEAQINGTQVRMTPIKIGLMFYIL